LIDDFRLWLFRQKIEASGKLVPTVKNGALQTLKTSNFSNRLLSMHEFTKKRAEVTFGRVVYDDFF